MGRERNISEIVWTEDRDDIFLRWFEDDANLLSNAGFTNDEALKMLLALPYVKIWSQNPSWLFPIRGLPKGYHWRDGQRFSQKRWRNFDGYSYTLLPVEADLYIKGMTVVGTNINDYHGAKIKNYRNLTYTEIWEKLPVPRELLDAILKFWREQELPFGPTTISSLYSLDELTSGKKGKE